MKMKWIAPKKDSLFLIIIATVLGLTGFSCSEPRLGDPLNEGLEADISGIISEDFRVNREAKTVYALDGRVILEFPEDAVTEPTQFSVSLFPLDPTEMCGSNLMKCGISIESPDRFQGFEKSVQLKMLYCSSDFKTGVPVNEENLTLYRIVPEVFAHAIGECTVDCTWKMISGCIDQCGFYVVGEN